MNTPRPRPAPSTSTTATDTALMACTEGRVISRVCMQHISLSTPHHVARTPATDRCQVGNIITEKIFYCCWFDIEIATIAAIISRGLQQLDCAALHSTPRPAISTALNIPHLRGVNGRVIRQTFDI